MKVDIGTQGGPVVTVPYTVDAIQFGQFIDFKRSEQEYMKLTGEDQLAEQAAHLTEAVGYLVGGDVMDLPYTIPGDEKIGFPFTLVPGDSAGLSVMKLYQHIVTVISEYIAYFEYDEESEQFKNKSRVLHSFKVEHEGATYELNPVKFRNLLDQRIMTAGEVITLQDLEKHIIKQIDKKGDINGNLEFALGCEQMAVLLRKTGERLPWNTTERKQFIERRAEVFQTLPLNIVLDVRFFLTCILIQVVKIANISFSGTNTLATLKQT